MDFARIAIGLLAGSVALTGAVAAPVAQRERITPPLSAQGIASVRILCFVAPQDGTTRALQTQLCERVRTLAAVGAPIPVSIVGFGDPAVLERTTLTILVHAAVQRVEGKRLLLLSIRPYRSATEATVLFGAPPVAIPFVNEDLTAPAIQSAIEAALAHSLPWRRPDS